MSDSNGKTVIVTGASRGIGAATAGDFAKRGYTVLANHPAQEADVHRRAVEQWRDGDGIAPDRVIPVEADVSKVDQVADMLQTVRQRFGSLDVLVNNAGINRDHTVAKMTDEEWHAVLQVNLDGTFYCCRAAIPLMGDGGRIINISSMAAHTGNFGVANYSASKAGILAFTKTLALELASRNITVNAICPGFIDTDLTRSMPKEVLEKFLATIPLKRMGSGHDIAACVLFLASDEASYITGQVISVNGGVYMGG